MRGIIMKKGKLGSVILTDDGQITKVMTRKDFCVGKEIPMEKRRKINFRRLAMVAAALVLVLGMASFGVASSTTSYSVNLDVNPSLTFNVNTFNVIIDVVANNDDAEQILDFVDLVGLKLNDGIKKAIEWLQEQGYLQEEEVLVISVEGSNGKVRQITRFIETEYEEEELEGEEGGRPGFEVMVGRITPEMFAKAEELGVPVGKIVLITKAMENGADIDYDAATELSVQEIQKINKLNANIMRMVALMNREKEEEQNQALESQLANANKNIIKAIERVQNQINENANAGENAAAGIAKMEEALQGAIQKLEGLPVEIPGQPEDTGKPETPGKPEHAGPPSSPGKP